MQTAPKPIPLRPPDPLRALDGSLADLVSRVVDRYFPRRKSFVYERTVETSEIKAKTA